MGRERLTLVVNKLPAYHTFNYARMGSFSLSTHSTKYIAQEDVVDYEDKIDTPSGHYRRIIERKHVRFARRKAEEQVFSLSYPYYAHASGLPNAFYVDLRRAYQQIALSVGYECSFKQGVHYFYGETLPNDALFSVSKITRGLLVTAHGKRVSYTEWKNDTLKTLYFDNRYYAPYLQFSIWRILHAIMTKLMPFVYYVHTDGVIINQRMIDRVDKILKRYHFTYAIKDEGVAHIKGVGVYRVGEHVTSNFESARHRSARSIYSDEFDDWWLEVYRKGVELRNQLS